MAFIKRKKKGGEAKSIEKAFEKDVKKAEKKVKQAHKSGEILYEEIPTDPREGRFFERYHGHENVDPYDPKTYHQFASRSASRRFTAALVHYLAWYKQMELDTPRKADEHTARKMDKMWETVEYREKMRNRQYKGDKRKRELEIQHAVNMGYTDYEEKYPACFPEYKEGCADVAAEVAEPTPLPKRGERRDPFKGGERNKGAGGSGEERGVADSSNPGDTPVNSGGGTLNPNDIQPGDLYIPKGTAAEIRRHEKEIFRAITGGQILTLGASNLFLPNKRDFKWGVNLIEAAENGDMAPLEKAYEESCGENKTGKGKRRVKRFDRALRLARKYVPEASAIPEGGVCELAEAGLRGLQPPEQKQKEPPKNEEEKKPGVGALDPSKQETEGLSITNNFENASQTPPASTITHGPYEIGPDGELLEEGDHPISNIAISSTFQDSANSALIRIGRYGISTEDGTLHQLDEDGIEATESNELVIA